MAIYLPSLTKVLRTDLSYFVGTRGGRSDHRLYDSLLTKFVESVNDGLFHLCSTKNSGDGLPVPENLSMMQFIAMAKISLLLIHAILFVLQTEALKVRDNDRRERRNYLKGLRVLGAKDASENRGLETMDKREDNERVFKDKKDKHVDGRTNPSVVSQRSGVKEGGGNDGDNNGVLIQDDASGLPGKVAPKTGARKGSGKKSSKGSAGKKSCISYTAQLIRDSIPEVITKNPSRCCESVNAHTVVYVTHAESSADTSSGFEEFWDLIYQEIDATTEYANVCFVMTGYNQTYLSSSSLSEVLTETNAFVSAIPDVPAMMSTDPTNSTELIDTIRSISDSPLAPPIGVFNSGWGNIVIEALVSHKERLQFVGNTDDSRYGKEAAKAALQLLGSTEPVPLCLNGRPGIELIGQRCATFYSELLGNASEAETGVACNLTTSPDYLLGLIMDEGVNVVLSHVDCCKAAADAVRAAAMMGQKVVLGCQDIDTSRGYADFVTTQPIELQAYHTAAWTILPAVDTQGPSNTTKTDAFPSQRSLINTAIFNEITSMN